MEFSIKEKKKLIKEYFHQEKKKKKTGDVCIYRNNAHPV